MGANKSYNLIRSKEKHLDKLKLRNNDAYDYLMKGIEVISRLNDKMFEAYIVGGAVRDILLNKDFNDIDICTTATPNEVIEIFEDVDNRYADMGVIIVKYAGYKFEVTTFRTEEYSGKSRIPTKVHYSKRLIDDILRRDYTVNALALSSTFNVIDITRKGIKDLKHKRVRIIGRGKKRYYEDPVRIFRGLELVAKYNFRVSLRTAYAMKDSSKTLLTLTHGRITEELLKIFKHKHSPKVVRFIDEYDIFRAIPEYSEWIHNVVDVFKKISSLDAFAMLYYMMDKIPANLPFSKLEVAEIQNIIKTIKMLEVNKVDRLMVFEIKYETLLAANYILINTRKGYKNQALVIKSYHKRAYIQNRNELNFKTEDLIKLLQGETGPRIGLIMNILTKKVVLGEAKNNFSMLKQEAIKLVVEKEEELERIYNNIGVEEKEVKVSIENTLEEKANNSSSVVELTKEELEAERIKNLQAEYDKEYHSVYHTLLKYVNAYDSMNIQNQRLVESELEEKTRKTLLDTNPAYAELFEKKGVKKYEKI